MESWAVVYGLRVKRRCDSQYRLHHCLRTPLGPVLPPAPPYGSGPSVGDQIPVRSRRPTPSARISTAGHPFIPAGPNRLGRRGLPKEKTPPTSQLGDLVLPTPHPAEAA